MARAGRADDPELTRFAFRCETVYAGVSGALLGLAG